MSDIGIRPARPDDAAAIIEMIRELAVYEREPVSGVKVTEADILRDGFGERPLFEVLLAEVDGAVAGFVLFFHNWSTWQGRAGIHVEDLFVRQRARGLGLGRRLLAEIAALAQARACTRVDLSVLHWNPARAFYERLGLAELSDWRSYRMSGATIARMAAEARDGAARSTA